MEATRRSHIARKEVFVGGEVARTFRGKGTFVPFVAYKSPSLRIARRLICTVRRTNTSLVRLKVPFSSPATRKPIVRKTGIETLSNNIAASGMFSVIMGVEGGDSIPVIFVACTGIMFSCKARQFVGATTRVKVSNLVLPSIPCRRGRRFSDMYGGCNVSLVSLVTPASRREITRVTGSTRKFICYISSLNIAKAEAGVAASVKTVIGLMGRTGSVPYTIKFKVSAPRRTGGVTTRSSKTVMKSTVIGLYTRCNESYIPCIGRCIGSVGSTMVRTWVLGEKHTRACFVSYTISRPGGFWITGGVLGAWRG